MNQETNNENQVLVVSAVLGDENGQLLLLRRNTEVRRAPGRFELPSGKVSFGEEPLKALVRIVKEQTGLDINVGKLIGSKNIISRDSEKQVIIFYNLVKLDNESTSLAKALSEEHDEAIWMDTTKLQQNELEKSLASMMSEIEIHLENHSGINRIDENNTTTSDVYIFSDGGSRGNPGPSAAGFVILNDKQEVLEEGGEYLGITTNNQAEYHAVRLGLEAALKYKPKHVMFRADSLLVVNQMKGVFKIRNKDLWPIHEAIKQLVARFESVEFKHVPRGENELADGKVNEVLDSRN